MVETRRTKDWITPEILEKSHQEHQMMAREAFETSDNVGVPIAEAKSLLSEFIPSAADLVSLTSLFDRQFFKLFFIGIGISGILALCTIGSQHYYTADKTDWNSMYNAGRSLKWTRNYEEAEKCFNAAVSISYADSAEKSYAYGELADLARRRGDERSAREFQLKESEYSQVGFGFAIILMASIILFAVGISSVFMFKDEKDKKIVGWHQPVIVSMATYAISMGIHNMAPYIPWILLTAIASAISLVVLVFSASFDGNRHAQFVTPSRD